MFGFNYTSRNMGQCTEKKDSKQFMWYFPWLIVGQDVNLNVKQLKVICMFMKLLM